MDLFDSATKLPPGVRLWHTLEGHESWVSSLAFDPQGHTLASGGGDNSVRLWKVQGGVPLHTLKWQHTRPVNSVAFDPKGGMLASGSHDETVRLWDPRSGKLLRTLKGHTFAVKSVAFDPQGGALASGSFDSTVRLWDIESGKLLRTLVAPYTDYVHAVAFNLNGRMLAGGSHDKKVRLWDPRSGRFLGAVSGHTDWVTSVAFNPRGGMLASGSHDKTVRLWDPQSGKLLRTLKGHTGYVDALAFSPDGTLLASKSRDQTVCLWRCDSLTQVAVIPLSTLDFGLSAIAFHPTEPLLATEGSAPGTPTLERGRLIHLWELDLDVLLHEPERRIERLEVGAQIGEPALESANAAELVAAGPEEPQPASETDVKPARPLHPGPSHGIFLCYRRDDTEDVTGRIWDRLVAVFGREMIFRDIDAIPVGVDFREHIRETLAHCRVFLAIIGREWRDIRDKRGERRLHSVRDHVRFEIETALARQDLKVVPVLVRNATLPEPEELPPNLEKLCFINGLKVRSDPDFNRDVDALITYIQSILKPIV